MIETRNATIDDMDIVATSIIEAERSGTARGLYERLFDLTRDELRAILRAMLAEEVPGSEFCCDSFLLAVENGLPVGAIAVWIEGAIGQPSSFVRATLLSRAVGAERWAGARGMLKLLGNVDIVREPGTLQIESVYVSSAQRGKRIAAQLIHQALRRCRQENPAVVKAQILSAVGNEASLKSFSDAGFVVARRVDFGDSPLLSIFPGTGRLLWERGTGA
jgi:ribosomal protein S18 acetylase RimI-like enzyme